MVYFLKNDELVKLKALVGQEMTIGGSQVLTPESGEPNAGCAFKAPFKGSGKLVDILSFDSEAKSVNYVVLDAAHSPGNRLYNFNCISDELYMTLVHQRKILIDTRGTHEQEEDFNFYKTDGPSNYVPCDLTFLEEEFLQEHGLTRLLGD